MNEIRAPGSDGTSAYVTTCPKLFKTQMEVFRSETSKATYWSTASLQGLATTPNLVGIHLGWKAAAPITPCVKTCENLGWIDCPVRAIDVFVDELDLRGLGFEGVVAETTGRPAYHPGRC